MFGKKQEPQKQSITVNTDTTPSVDQNVQEEQKPTEEKQVVTMEEILLNHESRLRDVEAALYRLKGAI
jgi:hypothetical protein